MTKQNSLYVKISGIEKLDFKFLENKTIVLSQQILDLGEYFPTFKFFHWSSHYRIAKQNLVFYLISNDPFGEDYIEAFLQITDHYLWFRFLKPFAKTIHEHNVKAFILECVSVEFNVLKLNIDSINQLLLEQTLFFREKDRIQFIFLGSKLKSF